MTTQTHAVAVAIPTSVQSLMQLDDAQVQREYGISVISPGFYRFAEIQGLRRLAADAKQVSKDVADEGTWTRGERAAATRWANAHS